MFQKSCIKIVFNPNAQILFIMTIPMESTLLD